MGKNSDKVDEQNYELTKDDIYEIFKESLIHINISEYVKFDKPGIKLSFKQFNDLEKLSISSENTCLAAKSDSAQKYERI